MNDRRLPVGLLFDYGGTLVEEVAFDTRAGVEVMLANVDRWPPNVTRQAILDRVDLIGREVSDRRDELQIEVPWPAVTRLVYDYLGIRFARPLAELELAFWNAAATTHPMPGAREALAALHREGLPLGVVSNTSFRCDVIRGELAKHGLAEHLSVFVMSSEYSVRKPNPLLFETAAALLGVRARDIWFVGDRLDTDVAGAQAAGMVSVLYDAPNGAKAGNADLAVATWHELLACVRARRAKL